MQTATSPSLLVTAMDTVSQQRSTAPSNGSHQQALPSIASLTSSLSPAEHSPVRFRQHSESREARDSGNWSISQSKRECPPSLALRHANADCVQTPLPFLTTWVYNFRQSSMPRTHLLAMCLTRLLLPDTKLSMLNKYVARRPTKLALTRTPAQCAIPFSQSGLRR